MIQFGFGAFALIVLAFWLKVLGAFLRAYVRASEGGILSAWYVGLIAWLAIPIAIVEIWLLYAKTP